MSIKGTGLGLALVLAGSLFSAAQAAPVSPAGSTLGEAVGLAVEKTQFEHGGRKHCFYWDGWHGPGWYWCGYQLRRGYGWGGGPGWHGWSHPPREGHREPPRREYRERH